MKNILFIHQSAELYGSDKTLLLLLKHLDKTKFNPVVIIPFEGPLKTELEKENIKVVIAPVLKLYRKMFSPKNIIKFFREIKSSFSTLNILHKEHQFEIIYSNTLAVLLGIFYAQKTKIKHIWHVHEIIESPKIFTKAFNFLLALNSNTKIIYNSVATGNFWDINDKIKFKSQVIWNGLELPNYYLSQVEVNKTKKELFQANSNDLVIGLIGRISRWKGQQVLLRAFHIVNKTHKNIKLVYVGSPPLNQEGFLENLYQEINNLSLNNFVKVVPFQNDINLVWQSIDIAVVPSTEPEPFGLVAVEAMLAKKPVIGSNHGGLTEIIINDETGFLVEPNNVEALSEAICKLIDNSELRKSFGKKGYQRSIKEFSVDKYVQSFETVFSEML